MNDEDTQRFWSRVDMSGTCWLWLGRPTSVGYGKLSVANTQHYAHRVSVELSGRTIPAGYVIDHLCRVRMCVNPAHLEIVTLGENTRRGHAPSMLTHRENVCRKGHSMADAYTAVRHGVIGHRRCRPCTLASNRRWSLA